MVLRFARTVRGALRAFCGSARVAVSMLLLLAFAGPTVAQGFPSKPIRLIAPFSAGGAADTVARFVAPKLAESLGQSVIVENRAGASGSIGSAFVAAAEPDGYTLLINLGPPHQTVQFFTKGIRYDPVKDFTAIAQIAIAPQALVVPAASSIKSIGDFVTSARSSAKGLSYGTSGNGTSQHLAGLLLASSEKLALTHIAYRGGAPALTDVVGGQVDAALLVLSNTLPFIQSGKLRALGVVENHRSKSAPDIPTLAEGGLKGFSVPDTWVGVLGPKSMPVAVVQRLHAEITKAMRDPEVVAQMQKAGYDIVESSSDAFSRQLAESAQIYKSIVDRAGVVPE